MNPLPTTLAEAERIVYGSRFHQVPYVHGRCAYEVKRDSVGGLPHQCGHRNGQGPGALYCKVHARFAPGIIEVTRRGRHPSPQERWDAALANPDTTIRTLNEIAAAMGQVPVLGLAPIATTEDSH